MHIEVKWANIKFILLNKKMKVVIMLLYRGEEHASFFGRWVEKAILGYTNEEQHGMGFTLGASYQMLTLRKELELLFFEFW